MSFDASIFSNAALLTLGIQASGFLVAFALQTEVFYDILGGINYLLVAFLGWHSTRPTTITADSASQGGTSFRLSIMTVLFVVSRGWLLLFLAWRAHTRKGDSRFDGIKDKFGIFLAVWMAQGVWVVLISWPLIMVQAIESMSQEQNNLTMWDNIMLVGFAVGIVTEIVADIQKSQWVSQGRQGGFCSVGLWKFSRHPNYFGEIFQWWCAWLVSLGSLSATHSKSNSKAVIFGFLGIFSPLFTMNVLLNMSGTGIWNAEGKNLKRYYESQHGQTYKEYRESTSPLIPMIGYKDIPLPLKRNLLFEWERFEYRPKKNN